MSAYENVIAGKLRLKGKALDVRDGCMKKKKKHKKRHITTYHGGGHDQFTDVNNTVTDQTNMDVNGTNMHNEEEHDQDARLTPAERRYLEWWQKIKLRRLAKSAKKSHRDRIQEFNHYLANLSEHYDIPKVGPG